MDRALSPYRAGDSSERGFTLVEMVAVSVLLSMLSLVLYGTLDGIIDARAAILNRGKAGATARIVMERMTRELNGVVVGVTLSDNSAENQQDQGVTPGSSFSRARTFFEGKSSGDKGSIRFVSSEVAQAAYGAFTNYGVVELSYRLLEDPDQEEKDSENPRFILVRDEIPGGIRNEKIIKDRKVTFPIASGISSLNFRFLNQEDWVSDWTEPSIPQAVEITLGISNENGSTNTFRTAVAISKKRRAFNPQGSQQANPAAAPQTTPPGTP